MPGGSPSPPPSTPPSPGETPATDSRPDHGIGDRRPGEDPRETAEDRHRRKTPGQGVRLPVGLHHDHRVGPGHGKDRPDRRRRRRRHRVLEHHEVRRPANTADLRRERIGAESAHRIALRGENKTVIAHDTMTFRTSGGRTEVTYTADFTFK